MHAHTHLKAVTNARADEGNPEYPRKTPEIADSNILCNLENHGASILMGEVHLQLKKL